MAEHQITVNRDDAERIVDLIETNLDSGQHDFKTYTELSNLFRRPFGMLVWGDCHTCKEYKLVYLRKPYLEDQAEADKMAYWSCDPCFNAVWAPEE